MNTRAFFLILFTAALAGCGSSATVQKSWVDKDIHQRNLQGVLVVAVSSNARLGAIFSS